MYIDKLHQIVAHRDIRIVRLSTTSNIAMLRYNIADSMMKETPAERIVHL